MLVDAPVPQGLFLVACMATTCLEATVVNLDQSLSVFSLICYLSLSLSLSLVLFGFTLLHLSHKVFFDVMSGLEMGAKSGGGSVDLAPTVSKIIDSVR